jgi:dolichol-phosphate mannosyltransferase
MYNEEAGAERCVRQVAAALDRLPHECSLIVIDDGSKDRTREVLQRVATEIPKLVLAPHDHNRGYGAALRTGIERAAELHSDYVLFMDSDLTNDPADIPRFAAEMERGADVMKASRFTGQGGMKGVPFARAVVSRSGNLVARFLFGMGLRDSTNGFRAVRRSILEHMDLRENGFAIIVEELYQAKFLASRYAEIPVVLTSRVEDLRSTSFTYRPSTFLKYLRYALRARFGIRPKPRGYVNENYMPGV